MITKMYLLNVPLENNYAHTIHFGSKEAQQSYFTSKIVRSFTDFNYQRKDNIIRIPELYDRISSCNYVMYQNTAHSNKWYYAFITEMKYINDGMTEATIETDVMQTYMFDYDIKSAFIEREHVNNDSEGKHTIEEGLQLGEYICNAHNTSEYAGEDLSIVIGVTEDTNGNTLDGVCYNNIYSGLKYYAFPKGAVNWATAVTNLNKFIRDYGKGKADAIQCLFIAPTYLASASGTHEVNFGYTTDSKFINNPNVANSRNKDITFLKKLDGYEPKNKKLLCYPYRYLMVGNNNGGSAVYRYEEFYIKTDTATNEKTIQEPVFRIDGCLTPGCSIRMIPYNYKGVSRNDEEGLNMGKYPTLNWTSDYFTNWITQNAVNVGVSTLASVGSIVGGAIAMASTPVTAGLGGVAGASMITSGVLGVLGSVGEISKSAIIPAQSSGNTNSGDVVTATGQNDFHFYEMSVKKEYAQIIDNYFNMYGYKVNRVGIPHSDHRATHWYIKTIGMNISGKNDKVPLSDIQLIKNIYNNGVTFWKSESVMHNYDADNSITKVGVN